MNSSLYLVLLVVAFLAVLVWAFGRKRKSRFDKDAQIPFDDRKP